MSRATAIASATARIPATCGELLQGVDPGGPLLVSLPVAALGTVEVTLTEDPAIGVLPARPRAGAALRLALGACGWRGGAQARLGGEVPSGRGLGASTIDVAGAICATFAAAARPLDPRALMRLATGVEPSDTSPLPGLWAADHVTARRIRHLGPAPTAWVVAVDAGGQVDTLALHARAGPGPTIPEGELDRLAAAVAAGDLATLGAVATASALRNQDRLPHPALADALAVAADLGAAGLCAAHSGTVLGVICATRTEADGATAALTQRGWAATINRIHAPGAATGVSNAQRCSSVALAPRRRVPAWGVVPGNAKPCPELDGGSIPPP
ncbi:MAG TPA: hypothetical protein VH134_07870 [Candidatus Dormibacteraeota bacterium]|nr:hypothetical protein [Candidatus Dormibacteraeota bacterium]